MPKITIYVPDDLKAEMDAAEKYEPNWSALAQEAFQLECGRIANRKRSKGKMDTVIERLRASKEKFENKEKVAGHAAGRRWASTRATYDELQRLAAWEPTYGEEKPGWATLVVIYGDDASAREWAEEFTENNWDSPNPSDEYVWAFVEGAEEVFNEVADKL